MTDKVYIVVNEQQEREVLEKFEQEGLVWIDGGEKPTEWIPSHYAQLTFPYVLTNHNFIGWLSIDDARLLNFTVLFDGRKEEKMSDKYVVSQEFMNKLEDWKETLRLDNVSFIGCRALSNLPTLLDNWWRDGRVSVYESNNRLIAIIRWVNGEDVFEVEKPKKWVVRSKEHDEGGNYQYVKAGHFDMVFNKYNIDQATRFDTKEEAQSWANSHQEVVEVEE